MTPEEFKMLARSAHEREPHHLHWLTPPKTLLFGYDTERRSWHVYNSSRFIHLAIYRPGGEWELHTKFREYAELVPNKRLYPESCDYEFCRLLAYRGVHLPFTRYSEERANKFAGMIYHGEIIVGGPI